MGMQACIWLCQNACGLIVPVLPVHIALQPGPASQVFTTLASPGQPSAEDSVPEDAIATAPVLQWFLMMRVIWDSSLLYTLPVHHRDRT